MVQSILTARRSFNPIISLRGLVLTLTIIYLLLVLALGATDIIASVVSFSFLGLLGIAALITTYKGIVLARTNSFLFSSIDGNANPEQRFTGGSSSICTLTIPSLSIPPLFLMQIRPQFSPEDTSVSAVKVSGKIFKRLTVPVEVVFPHRGVWGVSHLDCEFGDRLGLTKFKWKIGIGSSCDVYPPRKISSSLPILSSCHRPGDDAIDTNERRGDPYDLKPYHPSDGMKKILWKVYAKTGQLISRHPEPSYTPEGQVVVFALADKHDDELCGDVLSYLQTLEDLNLDIYFGCEGMGERSAARTANQALNLMIESVWTTGTDDTRSVVDNVETLISSSQAALRDVSLERVLIFVSQFRLWDEEFLRVLTAIGERLGASRVSPVFFLLPSPHTAPSQKRFSFSSLFVASEENDVEEPPFLGAFLGLCARNSWPTVI